MTTPGYPQFWNVTFPHRNVNDPNGPVSSMMDNGQDEQEARMKARMYSRQHGHATVTNREGMVATYVNGEEKFFNRPAANGMVTKTWDHSTIDVEQRWLDRAKELIRQYGITTIIPQFTLEEEMGLPPFSEMPTKLVVIAMRETESERKS